MSGAVGRRVAELRRARGLSQKRLARVVRIDNSHVSRIENGRREPSNDVLHALARALGCTVEHLATGEPWAGDPVAMDVELNFAELALLSGDAVTARDRYTELLARARSVDDEPRAATAMYGLAGSLADLDAMHDAVELLQELIELPELPPSVNRTKALMLLCRTSMQCGDMNRAVDVGEAALREAGWGTGLADEALIELASTLVFCYCERGDLVRARCLVTKVLARAEEHGSVRARASAYWNAGLVAQGNGDIATALQLTERALALFGEIEARWATAALRRNAGWLMLELDDPPLDDARLVLDRALAELHEVGSPAEIAEAEIDLARLQLSRGDDEAALAHATSAVSRTADGPTLEAAKARLGLADVIAGMGNHESALVLYRNAAEDFEASSADRYAATAWRRLAQLLVDLDRHQEATEAYARLADASGIPRPAPTSRGARRRAS
ncbi:MAG: helix-turn-helix domain-containing protein [Frankiaceae bacterium]